MLSDFICRLAYSRRCRLDWSKSRWWNAVLWSAELRCRALNSERLWTAPVSSHNPLWTNKTAAIGFVEQTITCANRPFSGCAKIEITQIKRLFNDSHSNINHLSVLHNSPQNQIWTNQVIWLIVPQIPPKLISFFYLLPMLVFLWLTAALFISFSIYIYFFSISLQFISGSLSRYLSLLLIFYHLHFARHSSYVPI